MLSSPEKSIPPFFTFRKSVIGKKVRFSYYVMLMIIDGKAIAETIEDEIRSEVASLSGRPPCLAVVLVGENPASQVYVNRKTKACNKTGILSIKKSFPSTITQEKLLDVINDLNANPAIDGILVQLPLLPRSIRLQSLKLSIRIKTLMASTR